MTIEESELGWRWGGCAKSKRRLSACVYGMSREEHSSTAMAARTLTSETYSTSYSSFIRPRRYALWASRGAASSSQPLAASPAAPIHRSSQSTLVQCVGFRIYFQCTLTVLRARFGSIEMLFFGDSAPLAYLTPQTLAPVSVARSTLFRSPLSSCSNSGTSASSPPRPPHPADTNVARAVSGRLPLLSPPRRSQQVAVEPAEPARRSPLRSHSVSSESADCHTDALRRSPRIAFRPDSLEGGTPVSSLLMALAASLEGLASLEASKNSGTAVIYELCARGGLSLDSSILKWVSSSTPLPVHG